jgi:N-acetylmuramoyl-L-alanine amidase
MAEPAVSIRAVHDSGGGNTPPTRVVIHATAGGRGFPRESAAGVAAATARYFQSAASGGSAHYVIDIASEEHTLPDSTVAWHAPPNPKSVGIEICADATYTRDQWLSPQVWPAVQRAAARTRELCQRFGIPMVKLSSADLVAGKKGICGHLDVSNAWHQSSHWDPGTGFPWDRFMAEVTGGAAPPAPPAPAPSPGANPGKLSWNLPAGHYYGNIAGPAQSHGGINAAEQRFVKNIQQWLIYKGCVPGVPSSAWSTSGWADGRWEAATDTACRTWHARFYPNQPQPAQVWSDDYDRLARP